MKTNKYKSIQWPAEKCPNCGSHAAEVYTQSDYENEVFDGEQARRKDCYHDGVIQVEDSECADIEWYHLDLGAEE